MEEKNKTLAQDKQMKISVFLCACEVIHLNYYNTTLSFKPESFANFALIVDEAYHRMRTEQRRLNSDSQLS